MSAKGYSNYTLGRYAKPEKQAMTGHFSISRLNTIFYIVSPGDHQKVVIPRIQAHRKSIKANANVVVLNGFTPAALKRLFVALGRPSEDDVKFINMKDVAKLPKAAPGESKKVMVRKVNNQTDPADWDQVAVTSDKGGFYIPLHSGKIVRGTNEDYGKYTFQAVLGNAINAGLISKKTPIYGIPASLAHYYKNPDNGWVNFFDWVLKKAFTVVTKEKYVISQQRIQVLSNSSATLLDLAEIFADNGMYPVDGPMVETVAFYKPFLDAADVLPATALTIIQQLSEIPADWTWDNVAPPHSDADLKARYPMLAAAIAAAVSHNFNQEIKHAALDYVNLIDSVTVSD